MSSNRNSVSLTEAFAVDSNMKIFFLVCTLPDLRHLAGACELVHEFSFHRLTNFELSVVNLVRWL